MEKRVSKKLDSHFSEFKNDIKKWFEEHSCEIIGDANKSSFLQYIFDYDNIELSKEDFQRRKRVKNVVPQYDRCCAYRANNEQCTRRKKNDSNYCGTHIKGTPHGFISENNSEKEAIIKKKQIWAQEIKGICYYIDDSFNIYEHEDIIKNRENPKVIAKYNLDQGKYSIPEYGI